MKNIVINEYLYRVKDDLYNKLINQKNGNEGDDIVCKLLSIIQDTHTPAIRVDDVFTP